ncbi:MAG: 23S rRNA (pseudouridine(1915)-N(3))-methyltransferase RlmH [Alphaproteobacteria bacterium]|nr:23S rRNA (pseudouridine(1915)-N(3))-methyltransferase RlmH [Alphaproteobacteria bacterium]
MKILLLAGGRAAGAPETAQAREYLGRAGAAGRRIGLSEASLVEIDERKLDHLRHVPKGGVVIAFDEHGDNLSSLELASRIRRHLEGGVPALCFAIGAADGLPPEVKAAARQTLAFGRATWPHMLVRVMAAEQIYRAVTILTDHPYHRS